MLKEQEQTQEKKVNKETGEITIGKQGIGGRLIEGTSKKGETYIAYSIYWTKENGQELQIKQVFLSDLELEMIKILDPKA